MSSERGNPLRILIENVQGPLSYPPGGFNTGAVIGSNVGVVAMGTSNLGSLRVIVDAMGQGISLVSGATAVNSGFTSGLLYTVQSAGLSGNQVGIRCFNPAIASGIGFAAISGGNQLLQEVQSGSVLNMHTFKVLVQGY